MQTLRASKCGLSTAQLPSSILDVIDSLTKAGYEAYIVGGGVRDLMLGLNPKDFDAVTNATPSQIKEVFGRRCRIVGRRFELAHVYSGRELIEVATFRAPPKKAVTSASGMILRDNNWGTIEQDFARRDFSINTLYYQPRKGIVLDFCKAIDDVKSKTLRLLGDPVQRFEEDPVRMLRTLRFAAKLNFKIDSAILDIFDVEMTQLLRDVSPHRLYDESQKLFTMGHLARVLPMLIDFGVWKQLFADIRPDLTPFIQRAAKNTDQRIQVGKTINPAFFYAVLLWQPFLERCDFYLSKGVVPAEARAQAGLDVL
ncbi:polynucleotide adenylyltransferase PcnB, partial [Acinetobacter baumannii]|nr:polynucleotide adenylyltransferase PcnB [Acinetobacter baumannii]